MKKSLLLLLTFLTLLSLYSLDIKGKKITSKNLEINDGDLIFQTTQSAQCEAVQLATNSKYSHMGIIFKEEGNYFVYEAVQPVKLTPLSSWIERGKNHHYVIKRLKYSDEVLNDSIIEKMKIEGRRYLNKHYDIYFGWSDVRIYCSELVWKIYERGAGIEIGELEKLSDFDLSHPIIQKIVRERYGSQVPLDETVISPASMFNSDKLITVFSN